jgi:3-methyladenine DNA glycosylase AlkD
MARPAGEFDPQRYFRGDHQLRFYNTGTTSMRTLARSIYDANRGRWSVNDAMRLADALMADPYLEAKSVGIEIVARYRRTFVPALLPKWKRWLAKNQSANWATTDAICGSLIGPLIVGHPSLAPRVGGWSRDRNLWVRRAAAVSLIPSLRRGAGLDVAYDVAKRLAPDREDLIQKAVGWMLREAGKADPARLVRYLRRNGRATPRTTIRYAIERMPETERREILAITRPAAMPPPPARHR